MNNNLDQQYIALLQDILDNGTKKETRNGETISVFGRQIRHSMKDRFPLLTTKKIHFKSVVSELLWFLQGRTDLRWLLEQGNTIWVGDCYQAYLKSREKIQQEYKEKWGDEISNNPLTQEEFINKIKTDDEFAKKWGSLGKVYGHQWRRWTNYTGDEINEGTYEMTNEPIDQISELIRQLKDNPDSRRLLISAWNPAEVDDCVLPPCHYGFQVYTRELSRLERIQLRLKAGWKPKGYIENFEHEDLNGWNIPTRAISLMWNQRSVDTFLGLPFNIASYGLLLELIAKAVNMVPDQLIGNLGDVHLYSNHIEQAKEQIGRELSLGERIELASSDIHFDPGDFGIGLTITEEHCHKVCDEYGVPRRTRQPYTLPTLNINTEFWSYEGGECGEGPLDAVAIFNSFKDENFCKCLLEEDIQLGNYQSHPAIKAPLSN
jgi:thymidylate synthase